VYLCCALLAFVSWFAVVRNSLVRRGLSTRSTLASSLYGLLHMKGTNPLHLINISASVKLSNPFSMLCYSEKDGDIQWPKRTIISMWLHQSSTSVRKSTLICLPLFLYKARIYICLHCSRICILSIRSQKRHSYRGNRSSCEG
jgi:hypothetical protein